MWYRHFASHRQIAATLVSGEPDLSSVYLCELLFKNPERLLFSVDISYPEEGLPARWRAAGDTSVQLRFSLSMRAAPVLVGIPLFSTLVRLKFAPQTFEIRAHDLSWSLKGSAFLDSVHAVGYPEPEPGHSFDWFHIRGSQ